MLQVSVSHIFSFVIAYLHQEMIVEAMNCSRSRATKETPWRLMYGMDPVPPSIVSHPPSEGTYIEFEDEEKDVDQAIPDIDVQDMPAGMVGSLGRDALALLAKHELSFVRVGTVGHGSCLVAGIMESQNTLTLTYTGAQQPYRQANREEAVRNKRSLLHGAITDQLLEQYVPMASERAAAKAVYCHDIINVALKHVIYFVMIVHIVWFNGRIHL